MQFSVCRRVLNLSKLTRLGYYSKLKYINHGHRCLALSAAHEAGSGFRFGEKPHYPGTRSEWTSELEVRMPEDYPGIPVYRVMGQDGHIADMSTVDHLEKDEILKWYRTMILLDIYDKIMNESQRQGRIAFYITSYGEEAACIGTAAGLHPDDLIFGQYRETGVLMYRGWSLDLFVKHDLGVLGDPSKGRNLPPEYGSKKLNFVTVSAPLAVQMPQAAGAAYAYKMAKKDLCVACYFGDGAASEGDAHAAFNFASTLDCPVVFICRNNAYAISTPTSEQYRGDGIASRAVGYGMPVIRVDGNDVFAVNIATRKAREIAVSQSRPIIIEAMTYRIGHHSTSDDSTAYRSVDEVSYWLEEDHPVLRLKRHIISRGWWTENDEEEWRKEARKQVLEVFHKDEGLKKHCLTEMLKDVYQEMTPNLEKQTDQMKSHIKKYQEHYDLTDFKGVE